MKLNKLILITPALLFFSFLKAQHSCGTDEYYKMVLQKHPEVALLEKEYNDKVLEHMHTPQNRAAIYTIPVVFHVIHTNGIENISKEQILDQLRVLNADFSYTNANKGKIRTAFQGVAADAQIKFVLASIDPSNNCTDGINRIYSPLGVEVDRETEDVKGLVQWNYQKYLNIWVVTSIESDQNGTTLGYAQFPFMPDKSKDGIVVRHDRVGTIGTALKSDSGRTLTHEIGHWLGLYHTFQDGCSDGDFCDDTPPVDQPFTNANCPDNSNSCNNDNPNLLDQWENYMDYSKGSCQAMYTLDQKARMHGFLKQSPRSSNVSASNLLATGATLQSGAPLANFTATQRVVCAGSSVTFYDISCKSSVTARSWTLPGSSTPSSNDKNPTVIYQTPGKYKVSLLVQNGSGNNLKAVDEYIHVVSNNGGISPNFEESFEVANPESRGFVSVSPKAWQVTNTAGVTGTSSFKAPISSADDMGTNYSFILPPVNLSILSGSSLKFTFYAAYAPSNAANSEILRLYVSTDCGNSFKQLLERSGSGLYYSGATVTSNFVPTAKNQWKLLGLTSLSSLGLHTETNAIFRIDVVSFQGNPVYIDNINISPYFSGTKDFEISDLSFNIYPNPASDEVTISWNAPIAERTNIELFDISGRRVLEIYNGLTLEGDNQYKFSSPALETGALYFVKITTPQGQVSKPITFAH